MIVGRHRRCLPILVIALWWSASGCSDRQQLTIEELQRSGELVVLTRNAPTTWYQARGDTLGPEHDLVRSFAAYLGVSPRFRVLDSIADILEAVDAGQGHIAAAGLTRTQARQQSRTFGPDYRWVEQLLVCRRGGRLPATVEEMPGLRIRVIEDSSYVETLRRLRTRLPGLQWQETRGQDTEELLVAVWNRELDCTIADSNIVAINRRYYPELEIALSLSEPEPLAWVVSPTSSVLLPWLQEWIRLARENGSLKALEERYYGFIDVFDYVDTNVFRRRVSERLLPLRTLFETAGEEYDLPWTLLAGMAYQESHWNPRARSRTGVRGLMMLTRATARDMGVSDRLDPGQSIDGGARYLRRLLDSMPESVIGEDRLWMALAAYNLGPGHLRDARVLAAGLGHNPDSWPEMKEVLPLLSRKRHYRGLKYGYARGFEALQYVRRVRDFYDQLEALAESAQSLRTTLNGW